MPRRNFGPLCRHARIHARTRPLVQRHAPLPASDSTCSRFVIAVSRHSSSKPEGCAVKASHKGSEAWELVASSATAEPRRAATPPLCSAAHVRLRNVTFRNAQQPFRPCIQSQYAQFAATTRRILSSQPRLQASRAAHRHPIHAILTRQRCRCPRSDTVHVAHKQTAEPQNPLPLMPLSPRRRFFVVLLRI